MELHEGARDQGREGASNLHSKNNPLMDQHPKQVPLSQSRHKFMPEQATLDAAKAAPGSAHDLASLDDLCITKADPSWEKLQLALTVCLLCLSGRQKHAGKIGKDPINLKSHRKHPVICNSRQLVPQTDDVKR